MLMRLPCTFLQYILLVLALALVAPHVSSAQDESDEIKALQSMEWRAIGPANMGGRVTDIDGVVGDPSTFYVSGADGGIFKTTNGGVTFDAIFEDQRAYSIGALAVAPSDPSVIWVGTGEGDPRNSVGYGWGVYRSLDAGETWAHLGLKETERIKRIVVDTNDPNTAYVCALGREWGPNEERGVFKTTDGGSSWRKVLYIDEDTGCSDLAIEESNPRILYAGMWTFRRKPWRFDGGGRETAPYKSIDGGETWEKITTGLPDGPMARIGISVAQSEPNIVYLITEFPNQSGTLFRSEDRGAHWTVVNKDPNINFRPFYYSDVVVDPTNPDHLYTLSGRLYKSTDGGKNFDQIAFDVHGDHQSYWIDPMNPKRLLSGSDGGYQVSYDAGETWDIINNVELSQFYQLYVDNRDPYFVCGGLQDNGTWCGPSNSLRTAGILKRDWYGIAWGDGYYALPIPGEEHMAYANAQGGMIYLVDTNTGNQRSIHPYPKIVGSAGDAIENHKYRFNWDSPIHISPHDVNTVYFGGNVVFKTTDRGFSWEEISEDLTNNDKSKQATSGGEVYQDNTAAEFHNTILTIAESPLEQGVLWVGTDDGHIWISRDGGESWTDVSERVPGLPEFAWVAKIHASEHDAGTAFVAVDQHRSDDFTPHAFVSTDYGQSWEKISGGLPQDDYVKVIRQDPVNPNLLYVGMEHGIQVSWDMGENWHSLNNNLPPVSVRDLHVQAREGDLVVGTHGRGAWILDDIRPLQGLADAMDKKAHIFETRRATRWKMNPRLENLAQRTYKAKNPDPGAYINVFLADKPAEPATITIQTDEGEVLRTMTDSTLKAGVNRIVWDLQAEGAKKLTNPIGGGWRNYEPAPPVPPGTYTAMVSVAGEMLETDIEVRADPRIDIPQQDYIAQYEAMNRLVDFLSTTHTLINNTETVTEQLNDLKKKIGADSDEPRAFSEMPQFNAADALTAIDDALEEIKAFQNELRRPPPNMTYRQRPRLREEIRSLMFSIGGADARPSEPQYLRIEELNQETADASDAYNRLMETRVTPINDMMSAVPQVFVGEED